MTDSQVVLGLETATGVASVALIALDDGVLLGELSFVARRTMAERLVPALDALLELTGLARGAVGAVAVGLGPGSFTSVRVGLATAKGIALGGGCPMVGIGSLEALAAGVPLGQREPIATVIAAPKRDVYAAVYTRLDAPEGDWRTNCVLPPQLLPAERLAEHLTQISRQVTVAGTLTEAVREALAGPGMHFAAAVHGVPRAALVAELGRRRLARGEADSPAHLVPLYTEPSEPERRLGQVFARHDGPGTRSDGGG